jgi:hypothetical protein
VTWAIYLVLTGGPLRLFHPCRDALAEIFVDLAPIFEGPREHGLGNPAHEVPDDIAHKARARRVIEYSTHQEFGA